MSVNRYSLSDHTLKMTFPTYNTNANGLGRISGLQLQFGGAGNNGQQGSFVGSISVARSTTTWTTAGDPTGSWVHNKNLDRTGTITLNLRQVSDDVIRLTTIARILENDMSEAAGFKLEIFSSNKPVAIAEDCYISQVPNQEYGDTAADQSWTFTCGRITFQRDVELSQERV